jgi:HK97 gp10 family phage protein
MSDVVIKGLSELQKALDTLPAKIEANVVRGGLRAGVKVIRDAAASAVPSKSGRLKATIKHGVKMRAGKARGYARAGGVKGVFYAAMVELGTTRHRITAGPGRYLSFGGTFAKSVWHPGSKARAFMTPAFESNADAALRAMRDYIAARLSTKHGIDVAGPDNGLDPA